MATVTFKGDSVQTSGNLPEVGAAAPAFTLCNGELSDVGLSDFAGKALILNIVPSLDTGVCATSAKAFNQRAADLGAVIANVSMDLPFAQGRFCTEEKVDCLQNLSAFRSPSFGTDYGIAITDGPLRGLLARAVVVVSAEGKVEYTELIPEITTEPNYDAAIAAVS